MREVMPLVREAMMKEGVAFAEAAVYILNSDYGEKSWREQAE